MNRISMFVAVAFLFRERVSLREHLYGIGGSLSISISLESSMK
jgi:hypothetical protein